MASVHECEILDFDAVKLQENQKQVQEVLATLIDLLEDYAPAWYTEELHQQAHSALAKRR